MPDSYGSPLRTVGRRGPNKWPVPTAAKPRAVAMIRMIKIGRYSPGIRFLGPLGGSEIRIEAFRKPRSFYHKQWSVAGGQWSVRGDSRIPVVPGERRGPARRPIPSKCALTPSGPPPLAPWTLQATKGVEGEGRGALAFTGHQGC